MKYRADIDGLRAVAIIPVVLFHAGFSVFSGGFVGVDVFFVISGYLITSIITKELEAGKFSIASFYERRIRRIFPALFAMLAACVIAAYFILMPREFAEFGRSLAATTLFGSNILFWRWSGYFDGPAEMRPLLHTWSLSVEEQFYIVLPLVLLAVYRWRKAHVIRWMVALAIVSFLASAWMVYRDQGAAFYWAPFRAWELLLGSLLAVNAVPLVKSRGIRDAIGITGLALIAWGVFTYSHATTFPGVSALAPCVGAAFIIYSGQGHHRSLVGKMLGFAPVVFVGLISYSLYLWHWPLLVFARYWNVAPLSSTQAAIVVFASVVAAVLSWRFIEKPFRTASAALTRPRLFSGAAVAMGLAIAIGVVGHVSRGFPSRLDPQVLHLASFAEHDDKKTNACRSEQSHWIAPDTACVFGADVPPTWALWGDSHGGSIASMIGGIAERHGVSMKLLAFNGCPSITGIKQFDAGIDNKCLEYNDQVYEYLRNQPTIENVILMSRLSLYINGSTSDFGPSEGPSPKVITDRDQKIHDRAGIEDLYRTQISETVNGLIAAGKRVVLVYPVPETGYYIPFTLARLALRGNDPASFTRPFSYYQVRHQFVTGVLDGLGENDRLIRVRPHQRLCNRTNCIVYANGQPLYLDDDHLNVDGAAYLAPLFEPFFGTTTPTGGAKVAASQH